MRLINITDIKEKLIIMVKTLVPAVGYIRVRRNGLMVMKKHWYSLKKEVIPVTDAILMFLPKLIVAKDITLEEEVNKAVLSMIYLKRYVNSYDIVKYLWRVFTQIYIKPLLSAEIKKEEPEKLIGVSYKKLCTTNPRTETFNQVKRIYMGLTEPTTLRQIVLRYRNNLQRRVILQLTY